METFEEWGFHEATVVEFFSDSESFVLIVDDAVLGKEKVRARITFAEIASLSLNGQAYVGELQKPETDGEILSLRRLGDRFTLIIEWNNFLSRQSVTNVYVLECQKVMVTPV